MIKKKEIIKTFQDAGFERVKTFRDTFYLNKSYCVDVKSRSKLGWTHIFTDTENDRIIELNHFYLRYMNNGNQFVTKLNRENENIIDHIIEEFLTDIYE